MNIGTSSKRKNITEWSEWFISMTMSHKLDINLFENWLFSKGIQQHSFLLVNQLQKSHTYDVAGLWVSVVTLLVFFMSTFVSTNMVVNLLVLLIIVMTYVIVIYKKNKNNVLKDADLIYQFREEYKNLIRRLNLGSYQKDFSVKTLKRRVEEFLELAAGEIERRESKYGKLSMEAESARTIFKENFNFYQSFELTQDSYEPYFTAFQKNNP